MEKSLKEILTESQYLPGTSLKEVLESYSHIELTEEEQMEGILWAKYRKEDKIKQEARKEIEESNRKLLFRVRNDISKYDDFLIQRAKELFGVDKGGYPNFVLDEDNLTVYNVLIRYFCEDPSFYQVAIKAKIDNPDLKKGILLFGGFGAGKTDLMTLCAKNYRMVYEVVNAKTIAADFQKNGEESIQQYLVNKKNAFEDPSCFYQTESGLCIDDIGTEDVKNHFGNKTNVIADLIEMRYHKGRFGPCLHGTINLTADEIKEYYGGRIASRLKEMFNVIQLPGEDRRK